MSILTGDPTAISATFEALSCAPVLGDLPFFRQEKAQVLLENPDRGLRMETYITLGDPMDSYPLSKQEPFARAKEQIELYAEDKPTLAQVYVYLSNYTKKPLDTNAFLQMKAYFELFRSNGIRMLLRFAYQTEEVPDASFKYVRKHLVQIGDWFKEEAQLIDDVLYCMQGGLVGLWGEGHGYKRFKKRHIGKAFQLLADIMPNHIYVQIRTAQLIERIRADYLPRIGMHQDYIIGDPDDSWGFFDRHTKAAARAQYYAKFPFCVNDGEMPWGSQGVNLNPDGKPIPLHNISGKEAIKECVSYALTSLSLTHNYKEGGVDKIYSMQRWKEELVSKEELENMGAPYFDALLDAEGKMSVYHYLKYHLGYLLAISDVRLTGRTFRFTITNYGMAAPLNFNNLVLVAGEGENAKEYCIANYQKELLQPMQPVQVTLQLPEEISADAKMGIKLSAKIGSKVFVRFANDTPFKNGVQYIYNI